MPIPTIVWKAKRTTLTGGRWSGGHGVAARCTFAFQLWKASSDSRCGIAIPYLTWPLVYQPRMCSEAPLVVL